MSLNIDLCEIADKGAEMEFRHPGTLESMGIFATVRGYDSEAVVEAGRAVSQAMMAAPKSDVQDFARKKRVAMAQAALVSVRGGPDDVDAVRAMMAEPGKVWIVEQVQAFGGDRASLFPKPETP